MVVHWHLTFLQRGQLCGKNVENYKWPPLEPLGQCCSNFIWSLPGVGEWKIAKMVAVHRPRWLPCPYMVKTFKNLLLQNRGCLMAEFLHSSSEMGGSTKVVKIMVVHWHLTFLQWSQVCFPMHLYGKMLRISNNFSYGASGPMLWYSNFIWSLPGTGEWKIDC